MAAPLPTEDPGIVTWRNVTIYPPGTVVESKVGGWRGVVLPYDLKYATYTFPVQWYSGVCRLALGIDVDPVLAPQSARRGTAA